MKKLIAIILFPSLIMGQKNIQDLNVKNTTLLEALQIIAKECDWHITAGNVSGKSRVSRHYENTTCKNAIKELLNDTPYAYTHKDNHIIIHQKKETNAQTSPKNRRITISGYVLDKENGETLIGANIFSLDDNIGTSTNVYGFYSLTIPEGNKTIEVSYVGYQPNTITANLTKDTTIVYNLDNVNRLKEVVITASAEAGRIEDQTQMSAIKLPVEKLSTLPAIIGEVDVIKTLQLMPGIQAGTEGFSGIYVRGGSPDQNLIMLDGVPLYNISHLFGIFSVFNGDAIKSTELIKGGYPARYGGRLSSILDIRMKDGNMKRWHGRGSIGLISSKLMLEGPILKDKMSLMVSGRRTYADLVARPLIKKSRARQGDIGTPSFFFHDFNAKLNYKLSNKDRLYLSFFTGMDKYDDRVKSRYVSYSRRLQSKITNTRDERSFLSWQNRIAALRWNHVFNSRLFSNITVTNTKYDFKVGSHNIYTSEVAQKKERTVNFYKYISQIEDYTARLDLDYLISPTNTLRMGAEYTYHQFQPGVIKTDEDFANGQRDTAIGGLPLQSNQMMAYLQNEAQLGDRIKINLGVNASAFLTDNKTYINIEPRIIGNIKLSDTWTYKASFTQMNQYLHLLTSTGVGLPTDLWLPPTDQVPAQRSWQFAMGAAHTMRSGIQLSTEAYYKHMNNLISYREGAGLLLLTDGWEKQITTGNGTAYGIELLLKKDLGSISGWLGYTWSKTTRKFDEINFGKRHPFKFDRTHDLSIVLNYKISDKWTLGANWIYTTGQATTIPIKEYDGQHNPYSTSTLYHYGNKNEFRFKPYHRLDLSISRTKKKSWGESSLHFDIYNVYNRLNTFILGSEYVDTVIRKPDGTAEYKFAKRLKSFTLLPIVPTVRWGFKF